MTNVKSAIAAISLCAAVAFPAVALAGGGHGPNQHANAHALHGHAADQHPAGGHDQRRARGHRHDRNAIFSGTVQSVAGDLVTVNVTAGNHAGHAFDGQAVQFDVSTARIVVRDVNGDGKRDVQDLAAGDRVLVQAWIPRDGSGTQPFAARRLVDRHRGGAGSTAPQPQPGD